MVEALAVAALAAAATAAACAHALPTLPPIPANTFWVGHTHTDVDSLCGAIAAADLFGGVPALAAGLTTLDVNFVLEYFNIPRPLLSNDPSFEGFSVGMVDHHTDSQNPEGTEGKPVVGIVDHHAVLGDIAKVDGVRQIDVRPVGSTNTILYYLYQTHGREIPQQVANCLFAGIVADTINLQGSTTTPNDRDALAALTELVNVPDVNAFAEELLAAKSNYALADADTILAMDGKDFVLGGKKVFYSVAETNNPAHLLGREDELIAAMEAHRAANSASTDLVFFSVTDVVGKVSYQFCSAEEECALLPKVYPSCQWLTAGGNVLRCPNATSRKSHMIPALEAVLEARAGQSSCFFAAVVGC